MPNDKIECQKAWPFRYAERFSGTSPPRRIVYFFSALYSKGICIDMKKSKSLSRLERQSPTAEEIWNIKTLALSWIKVKNVPIVLHINYRLNQNWFEG
ncbi:MAG: hypothetical protein IPM42_14365 [Saprospiraceae bacterium]|nr:hypothetical protein [Saprospiraceae bacterium]